MIGTKTLEERQSKFNGKLRVVKTLGMGTYIQAEGLTQSGGIVEDIWKQTLKKVKGKGQEVNDVLILGLGGGTVAKLVRKYWPESKITGIDIDPVIVELGKKYLGLEQSKVKIIIGDATNVVNFPKPPNLPNLPKTYDLVLVDLYQGDKFPKKFQTKNYIHLVGSLLTSTGRGRGGVAVFNRLYYKEDKKSEAIKFKSKLEKIFDNVRVFYPTANIMFICS